MKRLGLGRKSRGDAAERLAEKALEKKGYKILARNWRCPRGELDLVASDGKAIVFVEVRSKSSERFGSPLESITADKQRKLALSALYYLQSERRSKPEEDARFDVVAVTLNGTEEPKIEHVQNAFDWPDGLSR